ncbi:MAG: hypothetical protein KAQ69_13530, partial [Spirochaetales bacterium]|nr:hypothetical protein [Spirochaetales bacterium]
LLTEIVKAASTEASFAAIGLVEVGARFYLSPYRQSWFLDAELIAGFIASDYNFIEDNDSFMFETAGAAIGVAIGHDFGRNLSVEAGVYLITPTLTLEDLSFGDMNFIPFPKVSVTYMF